jgi:chorismate mutase
MDPRRFAVRAAPRNAVDRTRFTAFFYAFLPEENAMTHSVPSQTMQALHDADQRLLQLLSMRRCLAMQLAQASNTPSPQATLEERVAAVVSRLLPQNAGPLDEARLTSLFATVIALTEPLEAGLSTRRDAPKKG